MSADPMLAYRLGDALEASMQSAGLSSIGDEEAARLLAWALVMGGGRSETTQGPALASALARAARKFGIMGGGTPDAAGVALVRARAEELRRLGDATPWLRELTGRYVDGVFTKRK